MIAPSVKVKLGNIHLTGTLGSACVSYATNTRFALVMHGAGEGVLDTQQSERQCCW